jgi:hypothetical protein
MITSAPKSNPADLHRFLAADLFNKTWELIDKSDRTPEETDRMVHGAHASRYHWEQVGDAKNLAMGEWQISRVYSTLGRAEPALHHARRCLEIAEKHGFEGFFLASAYEGMARALAVARERASQDFYDRARDLEARLTDPEDRAVLANDLKTSLHPPLAPA